MKLLQDKKILITGLISDRSIAYSVAKICHEQGATIAVTYQSERIADRVKALASDFAVKTILPCDVTSDEQINDVFKNLAEVWGSVDGILHCLAFTPKIGLVGDFVDNVDRETFKISNDVSAYSYLALAKAGRSLMKGRNAAMVCLSYLGGMRVLPNYNMAGISKAALESITRYMAYYLGSDGIRVNAVSAGPIKTLAASGITDFAKILNYVEQNAPLRRNVTTIEVANAVAFLLSNFSSGITGEIMYVDGGYNIMGGNPSSTL